jgi:hypothetical protein
MKKDRLDNRDTIRGMDTHKSGAFGLTWHTDKERDRGERRPVWMGLKNRGYGENGREGGRKGSSGVIESRDRSTRRGDIGWMKERELRGVGCDGEGEGSCGRGIRCANERESDTFAVVDLTRGVRCRVESLSGWV